MKSIVLSSVLVGLCLCLSTEYAQAQVPLPENLPIDEFWRATKRGIETIIEARDAAESVQGYLHEYENLSGINCFARDMAGMPQVPSLCAGSEASGDCRACYEDAQRRLRFVRGQFEWLRCKYQTTRSYANSAIAFGDNVSGVHAVSGLAWQAQRRQIQESLRQFGETYDEQYENGIQALQGALQELGKCEAEHGGEEGWYDRFGFIYYTFMQDRYRRSVVE